jgi:hypothetical protein
MPRLEPRSQPGPDRPSPEDRLLIRCAGGLDDPEASGPYAGMIPSQLHWDIVLEKSIRHGVASLLHSYLSRWDAGGDIPEGIARKLEQTYYANAARAMQAEEQLREILGRLSGDGVDAILLKGLFLSKKVYQNIASRPVGDIDLLIHREDVVRTDRLLGEMGFVLAPGSLPLRYYREVHFHVTYVRDSGRGAIPLEIHWDLKDRFSLLKVNMEDIWARTGPWSIGGNNASAMCPEDLVAYLCYHAEKHACFSRYVEDFSVLGPEAVLENTVSAELLWYADILRLIRLDGPDIGWDRLAQTCRMWGVEFEVYASLAVMDRVFGTSCADEALRLLAPPRTRWLQAGLYRRLMAPPGQAAAPGSSWGRRLLESGAGLQFRPLRLMDILDYIFPDPGRLSRHFSVRGAGLPVRYTGHVLASTLRIVYSLGLLVGSIIWKHVVNRPAGRHRA